MPFALAAAAAYFTLGGSLTIGGLTIGGTAGWGGAVAQGIEALGLTGTTLGNVLGGAVQYAGFGALAGAGAAALTGGDIGEGAASGALMGAAVGGIGAGTGLLDAPALPSAGPNAMQGPELGQAGRNEVVQSGGPSATGGSVARKGGQWVNGRWYDAGARLPPAAGGGAGISGGPEGWHQVGGEWVYGPLPTKNFLERNAAWLGPMGVNIGGALLQPDAEEQARVRAQVEQSLRYDMPKIWYPPIKRRTA